MNKKNTIFPSHTVLRSPCYSFHNVAFVKVKKVAVFLSHWLKGANPTSTTDEQPQSATNGPALSPWRRTARHPIHSAILCKWNVEQMIRLFLHNRQQHRLDIKHSAALFNIICVPHCVKARPSSLVPEIDVMKSAFVFFIPVRSVLAVAMVHVNGGKIQFRSTPLDGAREGQFEREHTVHASRWFRRFFWLFLGESNNEKKRKEKP